MSAVRREKKRVPEKLDWEGLAQELQSQPPDEWRTDDLAAHYGVSQEFIQDVMSGVAAPPERANPLRSAKRLFYSAIAEAARQFREFFDRWTARPWLFFGITALLLAAPIYVSLWTSGVFNPAAQRVNLGVRGPSSVAISAVLMLQFAAMVRYSRYQLAWLASAILFVFLQPACIVLASQASLRGWGVPPFVWLVATLVVVFPLLAYAGFLSLAALAGKWSALRSAERSERRMSRQQMLERVYRLEQELAAVNAGGRHWTRRRGFRDWARSSPAFPALGAVFGLVFGLAEVGFIGFISDVLGTGRGQVDFLGILQGLGGAVYLILVGAYGFYAGGVWRGVTAALAASGLRLVTALVPFGVYGPEFFQAEVQTGNIYLPLGLALVAGLFGGAAGRVDEKAVRGRHVRANEPSALLAEWVRLQQRLKAGAQSKVIMAVDVARSTRLKMNADPLAVEFSFREYQALVARVTERFGGEVFSTAGDGALASFSLADDALQASKTIQTEINEFNESINRLDDPFRLRIGLHAGETLADFTEAPFNELIDIAAHVESVAPVGGIAATWAFRQKTPGEPTADINTVVDGHNVAIILNPMLQTEA